jgi:hypothetical protein
LAAELEVIWTGIPLLIVGAMKNAGQESCALNITYWRNFVLGSVEEAVGSGEGENGESRDITAGFRARRDISRNNYRFGMTAI